MAPAAAAVAAARPSSLPRGASYPRRGRQARACPLRRAAPHHNTCVIQIVLHRRPSTDATAAGVAALQPGRGGGHHRGRRRGVRAGERVGPRHRRGRRQRQRVPFQGRQEQQRHGHPLPLRRLRLRGLRHAGIRLPRRLQRLQCPGAGLVPGQPVEAERPVRRRPLRAVAGGAGPGAGVRRHRRVHAVAGGRVQGGGGVPEAGRGRVLLRRRAARGGAGARRRELLQRGGLLLRVPDGRVAGRPDRGARAARVRRRRPAVPRGDGAGAGAARDGRRQGVGVRRQGPRVRAPAAVCGGGRRRRGRVQRHAGVAARPPARLISAGGHRRGDTGWVPGEWWST